MDHGQLAVKIVQTPDGEDINSLVEAHDGEILQHLIKESQPFFFSSASLLTENQTPQEASKIPSSERSDEREKAPQNNLYNLDTSHPHNPAVQTGLHELNEAKSCSTAGLDTSNPFSLKYHTETARYEIKGGIGKNGLDRLIISLHIIHPETRKKSRQRLDLYEDKQVEKTAREAGEKLQLRADLLEQDLNYLADLLDEQRERTMSADNQEKPTYHVIPENEKQAAFKLLKRPNLIGHLNELIGKSGVIGEENNRAFLFCIASSHKMPETLHALVQGSSGSGKTHLVRQITDFMPPENVIRLTRVTESSFYNYGEYELQHKLIVLEDYDGLKEEAELAFRELQSGEELTSQVSGKPEEYSRYKTELRTVRGPIASMAATTRGAIYEDNLSRCFVIAVDESAGQTASIIKYQNRRAAGKVETTDQEAIKTLLQNCIRLLKPLKVINPYADKINLPEEAFKIRRLNNNFQSFVKQITLLNQYQRRVAADKKH